MSFQLMVGMLTCLITIIWGRPFVEALRRLGLGKPIRERGDQEVIALHVVKRGTPTFGGVLFILPAVGTTLLINAVNVLRGTPEGRSILVPLGGMVLFALLGAYDDWQGIREGERKAEGLTERAKLAVQIGVTLLVVLAITFVLDIQTVAIPTLPIRINLGLLYIPIAMFIILGAANAVNFTDGLDGLAGNTAVAAFSSYGVIASLQGQTWLAAFCFIMVGALFGFLWFNANPAQVFMGDTGSQAIGAALGIVALMSEQWLLLPIIGSVFVAEALSVIIQRTGFFYGLKVHGDRERGRVFLMAPIHHHFQKLRWGEAQIVYRFFFLSVLSGLIGIALALL